MRKFVIFSVAVLASFLLSIPLAGCEGEVSFTTASLSEATMCQNVDEELQPVDANDVFTTDAEEIFCSVKLSSAPPDTEIKAEWMYIEGELEDVSNYLIDDWSSTAEGTRYVYASLSSPYEGWPRGDYEVVLYIDGKEEVRVPFTVE